MPVKWLDNLLSHHVLPGVGRARQGRERRITRDGILAIELVRLLGAEASIPAATAVSIVRQMVADERRDGVWVGSGGLTLALPLHEIDQRLQHRLVEAGESVAQVRRGRPRRTEAGRD